jgi:hypothetical protein
VFVAANTCPLHGEALLMLIEPIACAHGRHERRIPTAKEPSVLK